MSETSAVPRNIVATIAQDYWAGLRSLYRCPREIWVVYLMKVLEGLCYFATVLVLMLFLLEGTAGAVSVTDDREEGGRQQ